MFPVKEFTSVDSDLGGHIASAECKSGLQIGKLASAECELGCQIRAAEYE